MPHDTASIEARIQATVEHLSQRIGPRPPGSRAEAEAARYLEQAFSSLGLATTVEHPPLPSHVAGRSLLRIPAMGETFVSEPSQFSAAGRVEGTLRFLGTADRPWSDLTAVNGCIGLLARGRGSHQAVIDYLDELRDAGLQGLIVISPYMDQILTKAVRYPEIGDLPVVAVSFRTAARLRRLEGQATELVVESGEEPLGHSVNVVARIPGTGPHWLAVSAHLDTAPGAPGATDNASGVALLLELARHLAGRRWPATVELVGTGSEEYGRTDMIGAGAQAYLGSREDQLEHCIAHIELDDVGNVMSVPKVFLDGSAPFRRVVEEAVQGSEWPCVGPGAIGCDHGAAVQRGIPYVWFNDCEAIPRPYYHTPADTLEFMDPGITARAVPAVERVVAGLASQPPFCRFVRRDPWLIRPMRLADEASVADITRAAWEPASLERLQEIYFGEELGGRPWYQYQIRALADHFKAHGFYQALVGVHGGRVVGYATYQLDGERAFGRIRAWAVHPGFQGRGLGGLLLQEVAQRMSEEGLRRWGVSLLSPQGPASHLCTRRGMERLGETSHYAGRLELGSGDRH